MQLLQQSFKCHMHISQCGVDLFDVVSPSLQCAAGRINCGGTGCMPSSRQQIVPLNIDDPSGRCCLSAARQRLRVL